jgi:hypothetical protein
MSRQNLIEFLKGPAARTDMLEFLKLRSKDAVIAVAADVGLPFTEQEFDSLIWDLEERLAAKRGEAFDPRFALWDTLWGRYYLEYLVLDLIPSLASAGLIESGATSDSRN